jgi:hypothetical protein
MAAIFDAYHKWLGIPPAKQPPDHYRLLGLSQFEQDTDVIESAADKAMSHVRTFQNGAHAKQSQKLLNELAAARLCLLDDDKRAAYDATIRKAIKRQEPGVRTKPLPPPGSASTTSAATLPEFELPLAPKPKVVKPLAPRPQYKPKPRPKPTVIPPPARGTVAKGTEVRETPSGRAENQSPALSTHGRWQRLQTSPFAWVAAGTGLILIVLLLAVILSRDDSTGVAENSRVNVKSPEQINTGVTTAPSEADIVLGDIVAELEAAEAEWQRPNTAIESSQPSRLNSRQDISTIEDPLLDLEPMDEPQEDDAGYGYPAHRAAMVSVGGGNGKSEAAVELALKWLAAHQLADGSWSFDHRKSDCQGRCANHGSLGAAHIGGTSLALLPFLGAGNTHIEGKYRDNVRRGLTFMGKSMRAGGSLHERSGNMYSHGLATIALCEAYVMTRDKKLQPACQLAIDFISASQDPNGGGWRYTPKQKGDMSVSSWQITALRAGHMSYLDISAATIKNTSKFLDSMQTDGGAFYGYAGPGKGNATTAIGLLCRMYLGWKRDNGAIRRGVQFISDTGPSADNMYYNCYATQVMRHYDGELWTKWNEKMRPQLVNSQSKNGHETGSWFIKGGDHGVGPGGRIYCTAMATRILEVYYRQVPIYQSQASEDGDD